MRFHRQLVYNDWSVNASSCCQPGLRGLMCLGTWGGQSLLMCIYIGVNATGFRCFRWTEPAVVGKHLQTRRTWVHGWTFPGSILHKTWEHLPIHLPLQFEKEFFCNMGSPPTSESSSITMHTSLLLLCVDADNTGKDTTLATPKFLASKIVHKNMIFTNLLVMYYCNSQRNVSIGIQRFPDELQNSQTPVCLWGMPHFFHITLNVVFVHISDFC